MSGIDATRYGSQASAKILEWLVQELVVDLAHAMRDNAEDLELALQDPEVVEQTSVLLDAVLVCRCIISPEKLGEFEELCGAYNLVGL